MNEIPQFQICSNKHETPLVYASHSSFGGIKNCVKRSLSKTQKIGFQDQ